METLGKYKSDFYYWFTLKTNLEEITGPVTLIPGNAQPSKPRIYCIRKNDTSTQHSLRVLLRAH